MLQLTAEEIGLLLKVSTMDIHHEYSGGPDTYWHVCPLCGGMINEDDPVSEYMTQKEFDRDILPSLSDLVEEEGYNHYPEIVVYQLSSEEQKKIPFPHKEGCEIEALRALHKKMKDFQNKKSSE